MRVVVPLIALLFSTAADVPQTVQVEPTPQVRAMASVGDTPAAVCRDRIQEVRREIGKPALDLGASPQDPLFIAAVDKRIGGCSVIVMRNDTSDIRPLPEPREHRLMPAR